MHDYDFTPTLKTAQSQYGPLLIINPRSAKAACAHP